MIPYFDPAGLRAGDVLLMKGIGPVSDLIAWFGDSTYSHAAIMVEDGYFVEAAAPVSRKVRLADRLQQGQYYDFIDALRPTRGGGEPLDAPQREAIAVSAAGNLDVPYPLNALFQMAIFAGLRNRIPANAALRWLLREIIDHLMANNPSHMVCSELVFRSLKGADLAPALVVSAQLDLPMPHIDIAELIREWEQASGRKAALAAAAPEAVGENELGGIYAGLRASRSAPVRELGMPPVIDPNPADVLPVDLETSPQLRRLGRLPLVAG